jgi:DNA-binding NtrC family response regulator
VALNGNGRHSDPDVSFPHVLIVDDMPRDLGALDELLRRHGFRVTKASTFAEAQRVLFSQPLAAIVADYRLRGDSGDGFDLLMLCAQERPDVARVLITAHPDGPTLAPMAGATFFDKSPGNGAIGLIRILREALGMT